MKGTGQYLCEAACDEYEYEDEETEEEIAENEEEEEEEEAKEEAKEIINNEEEEEDEDEGGGGRFGYIINNDEEEEEEEEEEEDVEVEVEETEEEEGKDSNNIIKSEYDELPEARLGSPNMTVPSRPVLKRTTNHPDDVDNEVIKENNKVIFNPITSLKEPDRNSNDSLESYESSIEAIVREESEEKEQKKGWWKEICEAFGW